MISLFKYPLKLLKLNKFGKSGKGDQLKHFSSCVDYIIVGGGSAGCVLANRLSEDSKKKVHLFEIGKRDKGRYDSWTIHMPSALVYNVSDERYNWNFKTEPEKELENRRLTWPSGKVLGGSSSLNAMCYVRGNALDFENWNKVAPGWSYAEVLPYFKKAQSHEKGEDEYRGGSGPLNVTRSNTKNPLCDTFINAGVDSGYSYTDDMNGYQQEGFGPMDCTVFQGSRWNTSSAYIDPILNRPNFTLSSDTAVIRILFENKTAVGVEYLERDVTRRLYANKEVILSSGAINSPKLLMLSGVGDSEELHKFGIRSVHHCPEVGKNLQDHLEVYLQSECKNPITLSTYANWWPNPWNKLSAGMEWFFNKSGVCANNHFEAGAFIRSRKGIQYPDIQYHFFPAVVEQQKDIITAHAYQIHCGTMRPKSRGTVKLRDRNVYSKPVIQANLMSVEEDLEDLCNSIRITIDLLNSKAFDSQRKRNINFDSKLLTDEKALKSWVRRNVESAYHYSGTCAMGSVCDSQGRLKGMKNLRVCDASIMPFVTTGNTNAPTVMMAEKISDHIKGETLPSLSAKYYVNPNWENSRI